MASKTPRIAASNAIGTGYLAPGKPAITPPSEAASVENGHSGDLVTPRAVGMVSYQLNERRQGAKTDTWEAWGLQTGSHIGQVRWYAPWRKYCFYPGADRLFDETCLKSIAVFLEWETRKHRTGKRAFPSEVVPA